MAKFTIAQSPKAANLILSPNGVGCNSGLTPVGEANNWQCVDDPIETPDDDTTYVHSNSIYELYDLYALSNHTTETGTINYVRVSARAKSHQYPQSSSGLYKIVVTDNACSDVYVSEDINLLTSYSNYSNVRVQNPRTDVDWTWDDIDNLQIGIECSSPSVNSAPYSVTLNDDGIDTNEWDGDGSGGSYGSYWYTEYGTCGTCGGTAPGDKELLCTFEDSALGAEYTIVKVTLVAKFITDVGRKDYPCNVVNGCYACSNETPVAELSIIVNGSGETSDTFNLYYKGGIYTTQTLSLTDDPDTGIAWTWAGVNSIIAGCNAYDFTDTDFCGGSHVLNKDIHLVVDYLGDVNPDIRTTQVYAEVNYTPEDLECTLTKPEQISTNHARNVKMLNFWNGDREVYDLNRSGKSMVLTGRETGSAACDTIICIRNMARDGNIITISELNPKYFNGDYRIKSFGWNEISEKPSHFKWILELEDEEL